MRIVLPNPLLHRRPYLKPFLSLGVVACLAGCAKFPEGGDTSAFTRIIVRLEFAGPVNPNYIYDVAIHASTELNPQPQFAPQPVLTENNPNGRMAGSPTHFVEYPGPGGASEPFVLYRFAKQTEVPNPSDPENPVNLQVFAPSTRGRIINFDVTEPRFLQFEIFTNQLVDDDAAAQTLTTLLVNVLTMNRLSNTGAGGNRVIDAYGDTRSAQLNEFLQIDLRANRTYEDTSDFEPEGDTLPQNLTSDPALDIVGYRIEVQTP
ncbi:MAG: hypothetical protein ACO1SV_20185 [Fimbriimonas sp.]